MTGGGSGIGKAIAERITAEGGRVCVSDINDKSAQDAAESLDGAVACNADVSKPDDVKYMVRFANEQLGGLNAIVNNAGYADIERDGDVTETPEDVWDRTLAINLYGVFLGCKFAIPVIEKERWRGDRQHRFRRRLARVLPVADRVYGVEGWRHLHESGDRGLLRQSRHPREFNLSRCDPHADD